jgi:hypothetical protein
MEDFITLVLTVLIVMGSSIWRARARQGGAKAPQKRTFMDLGRELIKQIEELDQPNPAKRPAILEMLKDRTAPPKPDRMLVSDTQWEEVPASPPEEQPLPYTGISTVPAIVQVSEPLHVVRKASKELPIKNRLNKTGLQQSIIMAEVLGPPRAKQPHSPYKR